MKLTRIHILIGSVVGLGVIGFVLFLIFGPKTTPSDTPIVIGGGSIYGYIYDGKKDGWHPQPNNPKADHASLHMPMMGSKNPYGTDYLTFMNFDTTPGNPTNQGFSITGTGGWAILVRNILPGGGPNLNTAVWFCSDAGCSAAASGCQPSQFVPTGDVYFGVRSDAQLNPASGDVDTVNFHDPSSACNPSGGQQNQCDIVYDMTLETCNSGGGIPVLNVKCVNNSTSCQVLVGTVHLPPGTVTHP